MAKNVVHQRIGYGLFLVVVQGLRDEDLEAHVLFWVVAVWIAVFEVWNLQCCNRAFG